MFLSCFCHPTVGNSDVSSKIQGNEDVVSQIWYITREINKAWENDLKGGRQQQGRYRSDLR